MARSYSASSLTSGVRYTFYISATDAAGNTSDANIKSATTLDNVAPTAPGSLTAQQISGSQINLNWAAATDNVGVTGYDIQYCQGSGCSPVNLLASPPGTSYNVLGLTSATLYRFQVRAKDAALLVGPPSPVAEATTRDDTPPGGIATLNANAPSGTQIDLSWSAATDNVGIAGYDIEYCQGSGCSPVTWLTSTGATSYSWLGLTPATSYTLRVRARDSGPNYGAWSPNATAVTRDSVPPTTPTLISATPFSHARVDLSWTTSTDNVGVTGYSLERCTGSACANFAEIAAPTGTAFSDSSVSPSTAYRYRLYARDAVPNWSQPSNILLAITPVAPDTQPPTAPSSLVATAASSAQINLSWNASSDNVAVTGYQVWRCQGAGCTGFAPVATPSGTSFVDSGLSPATTYRYYVLARDAVPNWSSASNFASTGTLALPDTQSPTTPTGFTVTPGPGQVLLSWNASSDNFAVVEYRIERCQVGSTCPNFTDIGGAPGTTFTDATATAPNTFTYRVRARDAVPNYSNYVTSGNVAPAYCD